MGFPTPEPEPEVHRSADTTNRCSFDQKLRRHGFAIHSRPADGPAVWDRNGVLYTQIEALRSVAAELICLVKMGK